MEATEATDAPAAYGNPHHAYKEKEHKMSEGINTDKVIVNAGSGGGEGGFGGAGMAAVIAALGNRNENNSLAPLLAALGNRNEGRSDLGALALLANRRDDHDGMSALWPIILLALLGRRGGFGGDDGDGGNGCARTALTQSIMEAVADIRAQVPEVSLEVQNAICRDIGALSLGIQQGLANVKDTVQNVGALNLSATQGVAREVATGTLQTIIGINNDGDKTRALLTQFNNEDLQRKLTVAQLDGLESRFRHHSEGVEVRVSQNVNQAQAQQQQQLQQQRFEDERFNRLFAFVASIGNQVQRSRTDNETINFGTMAASGNQSSQNTQVR